jgi:hypothetical protein
MARNIYFIDTENVDSTFVSSLNLLDKSDTVCIFYSKHSQKIAYEDMLVIPNINCRVELYPTYVTNKNYLDFQLITLLGSKAQQYPTYALFIVSNDTGFQAVVDFWRLKNRICDLISRIAPTESMKSLYAEVFEKHVNTYGKALHLMHCKSLRACLNAITNSVVSDTTYAYILDALESSNTAVDFMNSLESCKRLKHNFCLILYWNYPILYRQYKALHLKENTSEVSCNDEA